MDTRYEQTGWDAVASKFPWGNFVTIEDVNGNVIAELAVGFFGAETTCKPSIRLEIMRPEAFDSIDK